MIDGAVVSQSVGYEERISKYKLTLSFTSAAEKNKKPLLITFIVRSLTVIFFLKWQGRGGFN